MNQYTKKTGLALAVLLASSMFAIAPASAHGNHSGVKIYYSTGGYHDGHHKRHYKQHHWRRHVKRHHGKHHWKHWKRWKKHYRMHREHAYHDRFYRPNKHPGYRGHDRHRSGKHFSHRNHDKSGYGIKFYYYDG